ncbi:ANTAR domain-containing protein [Streptomyces sp. NPDC018045]|uniref:ANTAR domain-containing protein n=1 Tax=Streptomyces sp. NPDC018045 TaxID=3365037 RepID=UPI003794AAB5
MAVYGELDLNACEGIERELREVLSRSFRGLDLHLDTVPFCDCIGLNMLLRLRLRAVAQGKAVTIASSSRAIERLLELAEVRELFVVPEPGPEPGPEPEPGPDGKPYLSPDRANRAARAGRTNRDTNHAPSRDPIHNSEPAPTHNPNPAPNGDRTTFPTVDGPAPYDDASRGLPTEVEQLRRAMRTRPAIDLARGILMATFTLSPEAAWSVLVSASQNTNIKLHRLAQDLVNSVQGAALPEAVQGHLGTAVAKARAASTVPAQPGTATVRNTVPDPWRTAPGE